MAIDVPDSEAYLSPTGSPISPCAARAATISTPGAVMSGLIAPSPTRGPRLEKSASASSRSTAPTASAASAVPGEPTEPSAPSLPAAITKSVPCCSVSVPTASSSGSTSGVSPPLRLMLTTVACCSAAAHCMPARMADSVQP